MDQKLLLCGLGGQGVVFLSRLLARAALAQGLPVAAAGRDEQETARDLGNSE